MLMLGHSSDGGESHLGLVIMMKG